MVSFNRAPFPHLLSLQQLSTDIYIPILHPSNTIKHGVDLFEFTLLTCAFNHTINNCHKIDTLLESQSKQRLIPKSHIPFNLKVSLKYPSKTCSPTEPSCSEAT